MKPVERMGRIPWVGLTVLGLCLLGACGSEDAENHDEAEHAEDHQESADDHDEGVVHLEPPKLERAGIETAVVESRFLAASLDTTGEVDYEQDRIAHVSPRIPGRVHRVPVDLGNRVSPGTVLAVIDSIELGQAKASFLAAKATEEVARENHDREKRLYADRISSEKEMLQARAAFIEAEASRQSAEETLHLYGVGDEEIASLRPGAHGGSLLSIRAPFAGLVVEKHVTVGELVTPQDNLFTIADLGHVWIWIDVYERDLAAVHLDDDVTVKVAAYPDLAFRGKVTYVSPKVSSDTRTVRARIDVANPEARLRPGMFAQVQLSDPHAAGTTPSLVVPEGAIQREGEKRIVFVPLDAERFARREIEVGRTEAGMIEVLSGLKAGERVVTSGGFFLKSELSRAKLGGGHTH